MCHTLWKGTNIKHKDDGKQLINSVFQHRFERVTACIFQSPDSLRIQESHTRTLFIDHSHTPTHENSAHFD